MEPIKHRLGLELGSEDIFKFGNLSAEMRGRVQDPVYAPQLRNLEVNIFIIVI